MRWSRSSARCGSVASTKSVSVRLRAALVRALDGLIDTKWPAIQTLATEDVAAAQVEVEKLSALLRSSTERGISQDDLGEAFAKVLRLGQTLSQARA